MLSLMSKLTPVPPSTKNDKVWIPSGRLPVHSRVCIEVCKFWCKYCLIKVDPSFWNGAPLMYITNLRSTKEDEVKQVICARILTIVEESRSNDIGHRPLMTALLKIPFPSMDELSSIPSV